MFQQAANLYKQCATSVYGVTTQRKLGRFGQGCLLSPIHAITCEHVVSEIERRGSQILVVQPDGFFHCKVLFRDAASDIAIIETGASFHPFNQLPCEVFPGFSRQIPSLGMTVGYPAKLFKNGADNKEHAYPYCSSYLFESDTPLWVLSGGFAEGGFSGCPVFKPDSELLGLIVGVVTMHSIVQDVKPLPYSFPKITGLSAIKTPVWKAIADARAASPPSSP